MVEEKLPDYLTHEEIQKIINVSNKNHKHWVILKTLYETGCRTEEMCNIKIENIIPHSEKYLPQIHIIGKGKKHRFVPISMDLYNLLKVFVGKRKKGYIFLNNNNENLSTTAIRLITYKYSEIAGISRTKVHPHTFRHSRAVFLLKQGMTINELKEFLGHSKISTTMIYLKILPKEMLNKYRNIFGETNDKL